MSKQIKLFLFLTFLQLITIIYINAQFNYNQRGGTCCCCSEYAQHPVPYSSCCGRRKRQLLSALVDFDRRLYCCSVTGRKRREAPKAKREDNNFTQFSFANFLSTGGSIFN
uniref:Uncharacterized protein n=1 Tax=Meloidogyne enterolobii TaxID=390850 RepID=A0A6V7WS20_MELEN|nr:unnamed protein product [Meloidogyne enterolobii]